MTHEQAEEYAFQFHYQIYKQIQPYLSQGQNCIDFGCGLGIINTFTQKYFENIWLIDGSVSEENLENTYYGFHGNGFQLYDDLSEAPSPSERVSSEYCFYNDLAVTQETLTHNKVTKNLIFMKPEELEFITSASIDFVQSHMSWGWHFPFSAYKNTIYRVLRKNGLLIVDIRNNSLSTDDLVGFNIVDRLRNREENSLKYVLVKC